MLGTVNGIIVEDFAGQNVIQVFDRAEASIEEFDRQNDRLFISGWRSQFLSGLMMPLMSLVGNMGYVGVVVVGAQLALTGNATPGDEPASFGILVCGTGIGMSMTANHIPGIRAALCGCEFQARATRQHNNANVLCLGERVTGQGVALDIAELFLNTAFEGGRHLRRINQIEG